MPEIAAPNPTPVRIRSLDATKRAGSPARRTPTCSGMAAPVTARAVSITWRTLKPSAVAQVVDAIALLKCLLVSQDMGLGQIHYVDVVTDAGAVGRVVVVAKDRDVLTVPAATCNTKGIRWVSGCVMLP